jgi:hypothetical protein
VQYAFPRCLVLVDESQRYVETRFEDGSKVGSTPNTDEHTMATAADLGYGTDTWSMSRDHELAHTWLAHQDGKDWSVTMWHLAHPDDPNRPSEDQIAYEEQRVLDFQRDLVKDEPRPWDLADVPAKQPLTW